MDSDLVAGPFYYASHSHFGRLKSKIPFDWAIQLDGKAITKECHLVIYYVELDSVFKRRNSLGRDLYNPHNGAFYDPAIWKLRVNHAGVAKCLARYLRYDWRLHAADYLASPMLQRYRTWREHLQDAGIGLGNPAGWRHTEKINALEHAVDKLAKNSIIGQWQSSTNNLPLYHPDDRDKRSRLDRKRNKLEHFLDLRVCLPPPENVCAALTRNVVPKQQAQQERKTHKSS